MLHTILMQRGTFWSCLSEWKVFIIFSVIRISAAFGDFQGFLNCITYIWTLRQHTGPRNNVTILFIHGLSLCSVSSSLKATKQTNIKIRIMVLVIFFFLCRGTVFYYTYKLHHISRLLQVVWEYTQLWKHWKSPSNVIHPTSHKISWVKTSNWRRR